MTKAELDYILGTMLDSFKNVSDLNITADKPLQVESSGELQPVAIEPAVERLTPFQSETIAMTIINNNRRLRCVRHSSRIKAGLPSPAHSAVKCSMDSR